MPNIQLYIEAENHAQLLEELRGLAEAYGLVTTYEMKAEVDAPRWDSLDTDKEAPADQPSRKDPPESEPAKQDVPKPTKATVKLAEEMGVDLNFVTGTGKNGRVTQADVKEYAKNMAPPEENGVDEEIARLEGGEQEAEVPAADPFSEENTAPEPAASDATIDPTKDNAVAALRVVNDVHDMDACMDVLSRFDAKRIGDVPADKYGDFIGACATRCGLEATDLKERMDAFAS